MILRKPYAFLIKNFKRIHFILFIALVFTYYFTNRVFSFFNEYEKSKQVFFESSLVDKYINIYMFLIIVLIIAIGVAIVVLMRKKSKPLKLYISMIIFYLGLIVLFFVDWNYLREIYINGLDPRIVRIVRDANFIFLISQFVFMAYVLIRAIGFDIKKFDFGEDIVKLDIDVNDDEEFELTSGINVDKLSMKYRKEIRELKYFFLENKQVIITIFAVIAIVISSYLYINTQIINKIYSENQNININNFYINVDDSYITKLDYNGIDISEKGYTFLIVNLKLNNKSDENKQLYLDNLNVLIGDTIYSAIDTKYSYFIDLGTGYYNQKISQDSEKNYITVFKVKNEDISKKKILRYTDKVTYKNGKLITNYKRVLLDPISIDTIKDFNEVKLDEKIYYGLSLLKDTTLKINSIELNNKFDYNKNGNNYSIIENLSTNTIMKISYEFELDKNINYINSFYEMIKKFGKISYTIVNKSYTATYDNLTPNNYEASDIYLSINNKIKDANEIKFIFTIRNMRYTYVLK